MIDWLTILVPFFHAQIVHGGAFISTSKEGELQWEKRKFLSVPGSYSTTVQVKSAAGPDGAPTDYLWISGNPAKFLQGHNVFGIDDVCLLAALMAQKVVLGLGMECPEGIFQGWRSGKFRITMIDINYMFDLGTQADAHAWLRGLSRTAHMKHRGHGVFKDGTLYFGKQSKHWAMKFYLKHDEINSRSKSHRLPTSLGPFQDRLMNYCLGSVRSELRLHSRQLKKLFLSQGQSWTSVNPRELFNAFLGCLEMADNTMLSPKLLTLLPTNARAAYALWANGDDLRSLYAKNTYYRLRRILREYGIDISIPRQDCQSHRNVVPLIKPLEAVPKEIPNWAYDTPILVRSVA